MSNGNQTSRRERVERGIYKRTGADGKAVFEIGFRDAQGVQRWRRVQGGITAARKQLAEAHASRGKGERASADPRLTFNTAADAWWEARVVRLRPNTQHAYRACLSHLRPQLGRLRLTDISPAHAARYIKHREEQGAKGWTIRGELSVISGIYKYAARHKGFTGQSPASVLDQTERPSTDDEKPKRILSEQEVRRLLAEINPLYRLIFEVAAETGARLGETLGLVWGDIDLDGESVTFTHQLGNGVGRAPLKTKRSRRTLEIAPGLANKLRMAKLAAPNNGEQAFVFVTRGNKPYDRSNIARYITTAANRAGLEAVKRDGQIVKPTPTFHNLRHTHGSALIAKGWDIEEVSRRLGHSNVGTTMAIYIHEYDTAQRSQSRRDRLALMFPETNADASTGAEVVRLH